jgi:phospholipid-binding lipoprotein MlaA
MLNKFIPLITIVISLITANYSYAQPSVAGIPNDPFEAYNRKVFATNMAIDKTVIRPTTVWYINNVPDPVQSGTSDFFNNLREFVTLGNDILQLNGTQSMASFMRVSLNSTLGILGLIDVASSLGLNSNKNTFGKTLKFYGWRNSNYLILPLMGPSTTRDALGMVPDIYFNPVWYIVDNNYISIGLFAIGAIDTRAKFLGADALLNTSLDPYITMRDFYLQSNGEVSATNNTNNFSIDDVLDNEESNTKSPN